MKLRLVHAGCIKEKLKHLGGYAMAPKIHYLWSRTLIRRHRLNCYHNTPLVRYWGEYIRVGIIGIPGAAFYYF
ncbi:hypothetical protein BABINDRAFT_117894 [Babjeviella inositovora NRRL Y-12698]|uniref:Uncharacterized protein n=1 Tax=Babjeviella inositovora NRRL Y-12698 TaxID=984486 RepID=A0A1E3QH09_9ASCO|nr:uncharacterized protein BABINDRAFT_117894 [Babjeviella inositovora NRRL Y-12698]ODQ76898.1 hypothetical protein BABINDRAFT_117894 [Babjeviella inositovora NRRL Y-12698]